MTDKRPPGRPPGSTRAPASSTVSVWLPNAAHDRLIKLAAKEEQSISKTIRQLLALRLPKP